MRAIASFSVDEVARKARLPGGPLRLIDVGGSHGLYTIALCRRYPGLSAVIYDWPEGVAAARREIAQAGLAARIGTQTGDFLTDDLGRGYDVALLGNIIHGQKPPAIVDLLRRLCAALNEGGRLLIVDQVRMRQPFTRFAGYTAQMIGLFLLNELGGGIYPYTQVRAWLHETGYRDVRVRRLLRAPGNVLIQATANSPGRAPEPR
jgi:cyclopropane fatty-acyl-phospholipid synthase-like methyltransferase